MDGWESGDVVNFSQFNWGASGGTSASILSAHFFAVYPSAILEMGIPGADGFSDRFSAPFSIVDYLPRFGAPGRLTADLIDPSSDASGVFGGEGLALRLNVDYSDTGFLDGSGIRFGDLKLCGFSATQPALNGMSVRQLLPIVHTLWRLGG